MNRKEFFRLLGAGAIGLPARRALAGGAAGVSLFEGKGISEAHWNRLADVLGTS